MKKMMTTVIAAAALGALGLPAQAQQAPAAKAATMVGGGAHSSHRVE